MSLKYAGSLIFEKYLIEHLYGSFAVAWDLGGRMSQFHERVDASSYFMIFFVAFQGFTVVFPHHVDFTQTIKVLSFSKFNQL